MTQDIAGGKLAAEPDGPAPPPAPAVSAQAPAAAVSVQGSAAAVSAQALTAAESAQVPGAAAPSAQGQAVAGPAPARLGAVGWLRWGWRQLTSMRTALVLLFLLALASVPGSVLPQQGIDPAAVTQYYASHPSLAPLLARFSLFDVFGAPWFAAIYLLLFTSLAGCVLPRAWRMARSVRQPPPSAPRRLGRLPHCVSCGTATSQADALQAASKVLAGHGFRLRSGDGWVSAEKGYLHETGNLLFHLALLGLLGSVALGGLFGYKANRLLVVGDTYANTPTAMDVFRPGRLVSPADPQPFTVTLEHFTATYITSGPQRGEPASFVASIRYARADGGSERAYQLQVNHPLIVDGVRVFLIGHGFAPVFKLTDVTGHVRFDQAVPFIPVEQAGLTSAGVIKIPDAGPRQLGFAGVFLPTEVDINGRLASAFPAALIPRVSLVSYAGNLGLDSGPSQSVYDLNTAHMRKLAVAPAPLAPGQSIRLPNGLGTLTFTGYRQWISLAITYDPGQVPALISAILALAGLVLSFLVRRRRMFIRVGRGAGGLTQVEVAGLTRSDAAGGFEIEFAELAGEILHEFGGAPAGQPAGDDGTAGRRPAGQQPATQPSAGQRPAGQNGAGPDAAGQDAPDQLDVAVSVVAGGPASDDRAAAKPEGE